MAERIRVSGLAIVSALIFYFVASGLFGAELRAGVAEEVRDLTVVDVLIVTVFASALALGLAALLDRFRWGRTAWTVIAFVVLVASLVAVFGLELPAADLGWQALLHSVFGLLLIVGFYVAWPDPVG